MNAQALIRQAQQDGLQIRADAGQVKLAGPSELIQKWRPILAPHKAELLGELAANDVAGNRSNFAPVASSDKGKGVGQGRPVFDTSDANIADIDTLIQDAARFWEYTADDLAVIRDLSARDPEALRRALMADPLRRFYGTDTELGSKA